MDLNPQRVRQADFKTVKRGLDPEEVRRFLGEVADAGIPVFLVPGNHERSRIPFDWLARHPGVHVFKKAETVR